jgi:sec-independent protein translocase protein TatB
MFDVGLSEMMVIAVVALVVIGPERLPRVARTLGHLFGRMQRYVNDVKADINREIELDELRKFKDQFQDAAQSVENTIRSGVEETKSEVEAVASVVAADPSTPAPVAVKSPAVEADSAPAPVDSHTLAAGESASVAKSTN